MGGNIIKKNDLAEIIPENVGSNTGWDFIRRSIAGKQVFNPKTLTANGAPVSVNLWSFSQAVNLNFIFGFLTDVTDIADFTGCYFDVWDGTTSVPITASGAAPALTGYLVNGVIIKDNTIGNPAIGLNTDQVRVRETGIGTLLAPIRISPKNGVTNYIRFNYSSGSINVQMLFGMIYTCSSLNECVTAE